MNDSQLHELIGRKQVELDTLRNEYARLLEVLRLVKVGEMDAENLTIDSATLTWKHTIPTAEAPTA